MIKFFTYFIIFSLSLCQLCQGQENVLNLTEHQKVRAESLYHIVRCPVCEGQSLAGSDADIAKDLKLIIQKKIANDISDTQIKQYLVDIYGNDILFEPPINSKTFLLNYGIWIILCVGFIALIARRYFYLRALKVDHNTNHLDKH